MDIIGDEIVENESFFDNISYNILVKEILQLSDKYKDVLYLTYVIGYTTKEVSNLLNISQDSVYKRIQRAKSLLYKNIREKNYE